MLQDHLGTGRNASPALSGGMAPPWTAEMPRNEAKQLLGEIAKGGDPLDQRQAKQKTITVADLCELYLVRA